MLCSYLVERDGKLVRYERPSQTDLYHACGCDGMFYACGFYVYPGGEEVLRWWRCDRGCGEVAAIEVMPGVKR